MGVIFAALSLMSHQFRLSSFLETYSENLNLGKSLVARTGASFLALLEREGIWRTTHFKHSSLHNILLWNVSESRNPVLFCMHTGFLDCPWHMANMF